MKHTWESEFEGLLTAVLDGSPDADDLGRLDNLLAENPAAINAYISLMQVDAMLRWRSGLGMAKAGRQVAPSPLVLQPSDSLVSAAEPLIPRIIADVADPLHALPFRFHAAAANWAFSYVAATVLIGVALLVTGWWKVSHDLSRDNGIADNRPSPASRGAGPERTFVGRVTGLVNCRWTDPKADVLDYSLVPLGASIPYRPGSWRSPMTPAPGLFSKARPPMKLNP